MRKYIQLISPLKPTIFGIVDLVMTGKDAAHLKELTGTLVIAKHTNYEGWIFSKNFQTPFREKKDGLIEE